MKTFHFMATFVALFGLFNCVSGGETGGEDELRRIPFHEHIQCLTSSDLEKHWLFSGDDLQLGIASELDDFLQETFTSDWRIRSSNVQVKLRESVYLAGNETDDLFRGFLRQRGNKKDSCEFDLELAGDFVVSTEQKGPNEKNAVQGHAATSLAVRYSKIYAQVVRPLVDGPGHWFTVAPETNSTEADLTTGEHRSLQKICIDAVQSPHAFSPDEFMCSPSGPFFFGFTTGGDLGIWKGYRKVWSAGAGKVAKLTLQTDGNLVARDVAGDSLWDSQTNGANNSGGKARIADNGEVTVENSSAQKHLKITPSVSDLSACPTRLEETDRLEVGDRICSADEKYSFGLSLEGDLGIWEGPMQVWSAGTCCEGDDIRGHMQGDGNFVVYGENNVVLWDSRTGSSEMGDAAATVSPSGTVRIVNVDAGKMVTIRPYGEAQPPVEDIPVTPVYKCMEQVSGRIVFEAGQFICSPSGRYRFGITAQSGDLQLLDGSMLVWSAGTCCADDKVFAILQAGDGNLVVRNGNSDTLWTSRTNDQEENANSSLSLHDSGVVAITNPAGKRVWAVAPRPVCIAQVTGEFLLSEGQFICSSSGRFRFGVSDGDLSLWDDDILIWSSGLRYRRAGAFMQVQRDGNLVVRSNENNDVLWSTRTTGNDGASLRLSASGVARVVSASGSTLWSVAQNVANPLPTSSPLPLPTPSPIAPPPTPAPILKAPPIDPSLYPCIDPVIGRLIINQGDFFCSPNRKYKFGLASNGDLVLLKGADTIWTANTSGTGEEVVARLQTDGNLVVAIARNNTILWASGSSSSDTDVASLIVGDDGIVTILDTIMGHVWSSAIDDKDRVVPNSLEKKVMAGYQGWFYAKGDGGYDHWNHWGLPRTVPDPSTITIDAWPDLRELDEDELYPTGFRYEDGSNAGLYSAWNAKTVERHTKWMKDYDIDGVFVQRFIGSALAIRPVVDKVLSNVRSGSEKHGRTFVTMYDIGNGNDASIVEDVINDWKHLVDNLHITKSRQYLHHRGRPLVAIWGFGFYDRLGTPAQVAEIIDWFKNGAEDKYKATLMGGVPAGWRDLSRDSKTARAWASIYRSYDVISPWAVGRLVDKRTSNYFRSRYVEPDLAECNKLGIDYLPVAFPGFSFNNLKPLKPFNEVPRRGGTFLWHQLHNAVEAGAKMIYIAMFDEVDEATAIFKIAENRQQTPTEGRFITTNMDGYPNTPGDWYLNLTGTVARLLKEGKDVPLEMPALP